jgi:glycosyltransferase involved in cell wall biosynthesis
MIKVLQVVVDNNIGGIQNRMLQVIEGLKEKDIEIIVLTPTTKGTFSDIARKMGITVYQAGIQSPSLNNSLPNYFKNICWLLNFPIGVFQTIRIIKKEKIRIVHANGLLSLHAVVAGILLNRKVCWHLISTLYPAYLVRVLRPLIFNPAVHAVLITHNTPEYYFGSRKDQADFSIIFEPVDLEYFCGNAGFTEAGKEFLRDYNVTDTTRVISFIGNINPQKGLEYFIRSASEVKEHYAGKVKFLIIGKKAGGHENYFSLLQTLIADLKMEDDILFMGKIEDLRPVLARTDIFLMTSISEGTPIVILEAMAMEVPVIAPDVGGISDQVIDGKTGIITGPETFRSTSDAVLFLLRNPGIRYNMGKEGRDWAKKQFSLEKCVEEHDNLYHEVLSNSSEHKPSA